MGDTQSQPRFIPDRPEPEDQGQPSGVQEVRKTPGQGPTKIKSQSSVPRSSVPSFVPDRQDDQQTSQQKEEPSVLDRADETITNTLAPKGTDYDTVWHTETRAVPKTLGRGAYSTVKTALGMIPSLYHAASDPETEEESKEFGKGFESKIGPVGRIIDRSVVEPTYHAIQDYANGRITLENALSVLPEALGQGAGTVVGAKAVSAGSGKLGSALKEYAPAVTDAAKAGAEVASKGIGKGAGVAMEKAPRAVGGGAGAAIGAAIGHATGIPGAGYGGGFLGELIGQELGKEFLPKLSRKLGLNEVPIPKELDATGENKPFAGGLDEPKSNASIPKGASALGRIRLPEDTATASETARPTEKPQVVGGRIGSPESAEERPIKPSEAGAKPAPKPRTYSENQMRHMLGDVVTDKLKAAHNGPEILQRLATGTYAEYADLANYLGLDKPKALAAKTGPEWSAGDFRRSTVAHGKELNPMKELVLRGIAEHHPTDILEHVRHWGSPATQ